MTNAKPLVSIGMPVCNGERFIREALDSLIAQEYENFEFIISDNASTDRTQEICLEYAARDERVRYYRNETNMGPAWNFNRVFELSSGDYFMWASHDDRWDKRYLRSCLEAFDISDGIVLAGAQCESIDPYTEELIFLDEGFSTIGLGPRERFIRYKSVIHGGGHIGGIFFGVYKNSALREVLPPIKVIAGDHLLLAKLCFYGEFVTVQERLMVKRWGGVSASIRNIARTLGTSNPFLIKYPHFVREVLLQRIIFQTDKLTLLEKVRLAGWSLGNYVKVFHLRYLRWMCLKTLAVVYQAMPDWAQRRAMRALGLGRSAARRA